MIAVRSCDKCGGIWGGLVSEDYPTPAECPWCHPVPKEVAETMLEVLHTPTPYNSLALAKIDGFLRIVRETMLETVKKGGTWNADCNVAGIVFPDAEGFENMKIQGYKTTITCKLPT